jgi:hypothetical protein
MTLKYMQSVAGYRIMARNWKRDGMTDAEVHAAMKRRLNLERFDRDAMGEVDKARYDELVEFLRGLEDFRRQE